MSWNILPKNVLQYFLTKLKGLMYTKTEVDSLIPDSLSDLSDDSTHRLVTDTEKTAWDGKSVVSANPQSTTGTLSGLEIDGIGYDIPSGSGNVQSDWDETDSTADDFIKNKPTNVSEFYNDAGYLTSHQDISGKVNKAGDTMSGRLNFSNVNAAQMNFRTGHNNYDGVVSYQTAGNEAWLFTTKNGVTSIMFVNGEDTITNASDSRWKSLVPGLQIKNNKVAIGKLIPDGTTPVHALDVAGTTNIAAGSDTPLRIQTNSDTKGCYLGFYNGSGLLGYYSIGPDKKPYFNSGSDVRIPLSTEIDQKNFIKDVGNNVNTTFAYSKSGLGLSDFTWLAGWNGYELRAVDKAHFLKVTQTNTTGSASYRLLYSETADSTTRTEGARKGKLLVNPNVNAIFGESGQKIYIGGSNESDYWIFHGVWGSNWSLNPNGDNKNYLGQSGARWRTVYAVNVSINTSDRRKKKDIEELDDFAKDFIMALKPVSYKRIDGDRTHYGMIAQDVEDSMNEFGMTSMDFAGLCKDIKDEEYYEEEIQEDGSTFKMLKHRKIEGEFDYGLRYEEFIAPLIKTVQLQQQEIEELKHRIDILEGK